ncbi:MAG TPA: glycoside hydrolase family 3 protein [Epulopiscium sp.]|nr:glycoside hydrolase family 3 protein [Candidatus Epulonipiscium sp.]
MQTLDYKDNHDYFVEKATNLVDKMTVEEMATQLKYDSPSIKKLDIPRYNWWNEGLHGVARAGVATMFPQAIALAAMFDEELLNEIADVIATESRAKYNAQSSTGDRDIYKGLTLWSPNVNIFRDPRWGRGHETYGEDPYLTARLGVSFIKGLQGDGRYMKTAACAKHYAVHSGPENERHSFNAEVSQRDLWDTYLPAFEACVKEANVEAVMGAYNRTNGEPCCGSPTLLQDILRDQWKFKGHVVSDCWAIRDFHTHHFVTSNHLESAALALKSGCDLNCGNVYLHILQALQEGLITEEDIRTSAIRLLTTRFKLGMFDEDCEYNQIPYEINDCKKHNDLSLKASRNSKVLLKNEGILPLNKDRLKKIAVIGPTAASEEVLKGNYSGTASKYVTILEGIQQSVNEDTRVFYSEGAHLYKDRVEALALPHDRISEAVTIAKLSDVVILCLGLDSTIEGEEGDTGNSYAAGDKVDLSLPASQIKLLEAVVQTNTPTIVVINSGSNMDLTYADENCLAIIQDWYSGSRGGEALAQILFGDYSPSGRLPLTFYKSAEQLPDFKDYSMEGRTYRYFKDTPLYPFGYGLSYTSFEYSDFTIDKKEIKVGDNIEISVNVKNTGEILADEVVQVYIRDNESTYIVANHSLCGFKRVSLDPGEKKIVTFTITSESMGVVNNEGDRVIEPGKFTLFIGGHQPDYRSCDLMGSGCLIGNFIIKD